MPPGPTLDQAVILTRQRATGLRFGSQCSTRSLSAPADQPPESRAASPPQPATITLAGRQPKRRASIRLARGLGAGLYAAGGVGVPARTTYKPPGPSLDPYKHISHK
ncbi:hypothetical protein [Dictyobacter halimunensis]|uniref:hypothetical protein n=1 Tax=Dictyobacter halimunensis TaxID=3026934 RepID=UPI0030C68D72